MLNEITYGKGLCASYFFQPFQLLKIFDLISEFDIYLGQGILVWDSNGLQDGRSCLATVGKSMRVYFLGQVSTASLEFSRILHVSLTPKFRTAKPGFLSFSFSS